MEQTPKTSVPLPSAAVLNVQGTPPRGPTLHSVQPSLGRAAASLVHVTEGRARANERSDQWQGMRGSGGRRRPGPTTARRARRAPARVREHARRARGGGRAKLQAAPLDVWAGMGGQADRPRQEVGSPAGSSPASFVDPAGHATHWWAASTWKSARQSTAAGAAVGGERARPRTWVEARSHGCVSMGGRREARRGEARRGEAAFKGLPEAEQENATARDCRRDESARVPLSE